MTTLRIPSYQPRQVIPTGRMRTVIQTVRSGWVWAQRGLMGFALLLLIFIALLPGLGLYRPVTVLSGSMRPTFSPGDMVLLAPEPLSAVRVGQVISYRVPTGAHQVETHRVVHVLQPGAHPLIQTQGDANNAPDPWSARLEGKTAWHMIAAVPHIGYLVNWMRSPSLRIAAIVLAPAILALLALLEIWRGGDRRCRGGAEPRSESEPLPQDGTRR